MPQIFIYTRRQGQEGIEKELNMEVHICNPSSKGLRIKKFKADQSIQEDNVSNKKGYNWKYFIFLQLQTVTVCCNSVLVCAVTP